MKIEERDGQTVVTDKNEVYYLYLLAFADREDNNTKLVFSQKHTPDALTLPGRVIYSRARLPENMRIISNHGGPTIVHNRQ